LKGDAGRASIVSIAIYEFSIPVYTVLGRTSAAVHRAIRDNFQEKHESKIGNGHITGINFADKISEFGFHMNTSFFGLDASHDTPTQDAKQGAKNLEKVTQPVNSR
jgi:hypothetical protein